MQYDKIEEAVLSCFLIEPNLMRKTMLEDKHFYKYKFVYVFFKEVYDMYKSLDINVLFSCIRETSEEPLCNALTKILDVFVIPTEFYAYEKRLIIQYGVKKRDEWLKEKYNEQMIQLNIGKINVDEFRQNINDIYEKSNTVNWR